MAKNKLPTADVTEDPHYHDTWTLLRKYRDVVWSLEVSVRQVRNRFRIDYGKTIEDFLESVYLAGADLSGTELEHQANESIDVANFVKAARIYAYAILALCA